MHTVDLVTLCVNTRRLLDEEEPKLPKTNGPAGLPLLDKTEKKKFTYSLLFTLTFVLRVQCTSVRYPNSVR